jgi:hypothetical protein
MEFHLNLHVFISSRQLSSPRGSRQDPLCEELCVSNCSVKLEFLLTVISWSPQTIEFTKRIYGLLFVTLFLVPILNISSILEMVVGYANEEEEGFQVRNFWGAQFLLTKQVLTWFYVLLWSLCNNISFFKRCRYIFFYCSGNVSSLSTTAPISSTRWFWWPSLAAPFPF